MHDAQATHASLENFIRSFTLVTKPAAALPSPDCWESRPNSTSAVDRALTQWGVEFAYGSCGSAAASGSIEKDSRRRHPSCGATKIGFDMWTLRRFSDDETWKVPNCSLQMALAYFGAESEIHCMLEPCDKGSGEFGLLEVGKGLVDSVDVQVRRVRTAPLN